MVPSGTANLVLFFEPIFGLFGGHGEVLPHMLLTLVIYLYNLFCYFLELMLQKSTGF